MNRESDRSKPKPDTPTGTAGPPTFDSVFKYLIYGLSLPERTLRGTSAIVGGTLRESAALLVPTAFQNSKTYRIFVSQMLDFLARDVGGAQVPSGDGDSAEPEVQAFVARKAVGNFIELAGIATLHLSPLTLLALISDVAYGSQTYLKELAAELKQQGLIGEQSTIDNAQDLLRSIANASGVTAATIDLPPLATADLAESVSGTLDALNEIDVRKVLPQAELERLWQSMRDTARRQNVSLFGLSTAMTLVGMQQINTAGKGTIASLQVATLLVDRHILDHYRGGLRQISEEGFYPVLSRVSSPYIEALWNNFSGTKGTITEEVLSGRMLRTSVKHLRNWFFPRPPAAPPPDAAPPSEHE